MGDSLSKKEVSEALEQADEREVYMDIAWDRAAKEELTEAEVQTRRLMEENEKLREEIERVRSLPMKERIYDHVHVSVRTMDIFIGVMLVLAVIAVILGMT